MFLLSPTKVQGTFGVIREKTLKYHYILKLKPNNVHMLVQLLHRGFVLAVIQRSSALIASQASFKRISVSTPLHLAARVGPIQLQQITSKEMEAFEDILSSWAVGSSLTPLSGSV